jgi:Fe-S-cluster containining protein
MPVDFTPYFAKYEAIVSITDGIFDQIKKEYPEEVKCKEGCCDCCHALFDLTLIEALYINYHFNQTFDGETRARMIEDASRIDRQIFKIKNEAFQLHKKGKNEVDILAFTATQRVRCPLLNDNERCDLYEHRPITCRIYGVPISSNGMSHICGRSGFKKGRPYPTINMDTIYKNLYKLSAELVSDIKSRYIKMADLLVPLSNAIITDYDDYYLGLKVKEENDPEAPALKKRKNRRPHV